MRSNPISFNPCSARTTLPQESTVEPPVVIPLTSTRSFDERIVSIGGNSLVIFFSLPKRPVLLKGPASDKSRLNGLNSFPASSIITSNPSFANLRAAVAPPAPVPTTIALIFLPHLYMPYIQMRHQ